MLKMETVQIVQRKRLEDEHKAKLEELEARNTLIAQRGIQAAIEYERQLEERRAWPWFIAWIVITVIGCCII